MPLLTDPDELHQGTESAETLAWTSSSGATTTLTGTGLPAIAADEFFEIRDHSVAVNNGLYKESGGSPSTSSVTADKITGSDPSDEASEAVNWLGDSTSLAKNVMYDTAGRQVLLLEQELLVAAGVTFNAWYSFTKEEWKDDDFLKQFPFPVFAIDLDAGKYQIGTDGSNANGWVFLDDSGNSIRTRKLLRSAGWAEVDTAGITIAIHAGITTLGVFEDVATDLAFYQFGTDTTKDDTVDFDFAGPVDEAVLCFEEQPQTDLVITSTTDIARTGGDFVAEGYKVGGEVTIRNAEDAGNNGSHVLTSVATTLLQTTGLTNNADDTAAILAVDNRKAFSCKIRVRDGDPSGKTFDAANLASAGKSTLNNFLFAFPLANASDLKISAVDTDIDSNSDGTPDTAPYTSMTITYFGSAQSKSGLVGGSFDFGIVIDADGGTAIEVYEFVQWSLRATGGDGSGDIDDDADFAYGRAMDDLLVFEGDILVAGNSIPLNPDGGGSGVFIENISGVDQNNLRLLDNLGDRKQFPETVALTIDFNDAVIDDTVAEFTLFFDRTIRNTVDATFSVVAGSGSAGTFASTAQFPASLDGGVNAYVRVVGLTGVDAAMNGIYQVTALTSTSLWSVERYDGATIVTTAGEAASIDEHVVNAPDAIIVDDDVPAPLTGLANADVNANFDFDGNVQGGRPVSQETFVVCRAIGLAGAQFVQSGVQSIASQTPLTIVMTASNELNYVT